MRFNFSVLSSFESVSSIEETKLNDLLHITQNEENGGYIESFDGASGAIMYVTSALSPVVFVVIHALLGGIWIGYN